MYGQSAATAYQTMAKKATTPRELEAEILTKAANKFYQIANNWETEKKTLRDALQYNQKLWTIFVSNASDPECQLPLTLRNNVANLGVFVFKRTAQLMASPDKDMLQILITINRELAAGLRD